ncbi:MAG: NADP-dependent oxidoreductase [Chitinophagaceae bacterium]|nr:NADP-dependent oxidoreductase [Chitinophagaceae bacterium]
MKAIILKEAGTADNLIFTELPRPVPGDNEVLLAVKAIGINPVDIKTRSGMSVYNDLKSKNPFIILGWDVSGVVMEVGKNVTKFKVGDEVFGMVNFPGHGRAYAEFVAARENDISKKPSNISHQEAAAASLAALTAWQAIVTNGKVKIGQRVVIQAAAGGVGHYAVQIARYLGAYVIGTSSAANEKFVMGLGAHKHIDYTKHRLSELVDDADFVLDPIGGGNIDISIDAAKKGGTVIMLPSQHKDEIANKAKTKGVNGLYFSVRPNEENLQQIASLLKAGTLKSHVSQTFEFLQMKEAHKQIETGRTVGKIVVTV